MAFKHSISFATYLATNFGCNSLRITPDIIFKLLRAAIWSSSAVWFKSEQTPFSWTGCDSTGLSPQVHRNFPRKKSGILLEKSSTSRENLVKITGFSPLQTALKWHSSIFLSTFLSRNTHVTPPARPEPGQHPCPAPLPCHLARPCPPCPLWPSQVLHLQPNFSLSTVTVFFLRHQGFFPCVRQRGKDSVQKEKTHLLCWSSFAPRSVQYISCAQETCWAAASCMYTMLHMSWQLSQISMLTLTVTPSYGFFCFFHITSSGCCCCSAAWLQLHEYD